MTMESKEDLAYRYYDMSSWDEMLRSLQEMEKALEVSGNHPDIEDGAKKMQEAMYKMYEGYKMNELSGNYLADNEDVNAKKVMGSQGNHPSTGSPVFETTPTLAQQGSNEELVEHVKPRVLEFEDPAEVGTTEQLDDEFKEFVRRYHKRGNHAGEGNCGAQPCIGERESAVREKHEHRLLRCGGPYARPPDEIPTPS